MMSYRVDHLTKIPKPKGLFGVGTIDKNQEKQSTFSELEKLHEEVNSKVTAVYVHQLQCCLLYFPPVLFSNTPWSHLSHPLSEYH